MLRAFLHIVLIQAVFLGSVLPLYAIYTSKRTLVPICAPQKIPVALPSEPLCKATD